MSLVSEALRKARQEAADKGVRQRGMVFRTTVVLGPGGAGAPLGWIVAVVVGVSALAGAGVALLVLGARGAAPAPTAAPAARPPVASLFRPTPAAAPAGAPSSTGRPAAVKPPGGAAAAAPRRPAETVALGDRSPAPPAAASAPGGTAEPAASESGEARAPRRSAEASGDGARSFVIDADLGRVKFHLDYIVYRASGPFAGINGQQVVVGTLIEGYTVEEIDPDAIHLRNARGAVVLRSH